MDGGTVVVVEDRLVSNLVRAVLRKHGYDVVLAEAAEALAMIRAPESGVDILITNSPEEFLEFGDRIPLLYLTSMPDPALQAAFLDCRVVLKPFLPGDLTAAVGALISGQHPISE